MKLGRVNDEDMVTIRHGRGNYLVAEARELKGAGLGHAELSGGFWGEWTLRVRSRREFQRLQSIIPDEDI